MGTNVGEGTGREEVPPHLRVQRAPPFVRPLTGLNHDELGSVYSEIRTWRTRLKTINEDIRIAQEEGYQFIADGARVKGWLLTGRGLRFIPGVELIKGHAKEDGGKGPPGVYIHEDRSTLFDTNHILMTL
jgi:hypothetical protein